MRTNVGTMWHIIVDSWVQHMQVRLGEERGGGSDDG